MLLRLHISLLRTAYRSSILGCERFSSNVTPVKENVVQLPVEKVKDELKKHADTFGNYSEIVSKFDMVPDDPEDVKERKRKKLMDRKSAPFYINVIKTHLDKHEFEKAKEVLEERMLKIDKVRPDSYVYDLLISYCGRTGNVKDAFKLYNQIKKRGYHVTGGQYTSIFNACANSPMSQYALEVASKVRKYISKDELHKANIKNYNAMIKAFGRHGDLQACFEVMDEVLERRGKVRSDTYNFLLQACITDRATGFRHALLLWHKMFQNKTDPCIFTFNLLLRVTRDCSLGVPEQIQPVIQSILQEGNTRFLRKLKIIDAKPPTPPPSNDEPLVAIESKEMPHGERKENLESVYESHTPQEIDNSLPLTSIREEERMNLPNLMALKPHIGGVLDFSKFTTSYHRLMLLGGATGFLQVMESMHVKPDMKTFTLLLEIIPSTVQAEEDLMNLIRGRKVKFDTKFFNALIKRRSFRKDYTAAKDVLQLLQAEGLQADIMTFGSLALGCKTREEGDELIKNLHEAGFRANSQILGSLVRQAIYAGDIRYVKDILATMQEDEVVPSAKLMVFLNEFMEKEKEKLKSEAK